MNWLSLKRLEDKDECETERMVIDGEKPVVSGTQLNVIVRNTRKRK